MGGTTLAVAGRLRLEWPTLLLAGVIHAAFMALTWWHALLPWYVWAPLIAYVVAWHASLQHEIVHGHPTRWRGFNHAIASLPLLLWLPFEIYRVEHLAHHRDDHLTDPLDDPESYYVTAARWRLLPGWRRRLLLWRNTVTGRLVLGPPTIVAEFLAAQARAFAADRPGVRAAWMRHAAGLAVVLFWLVAICGLPLWYYLLGAVWPGTALMLLRSYLEHQARPTVDHRTAIVEAGPLMRLLYLNNNLHVVHHARPAVPWYRLPTLYAAERERWRQQNGGYVIAGGYAEILRRHWRRAKEPPIHPRENDSAAAI